MTSSKDTSGTTEFSRLHDISNITADLGNILSILASLNSFTISYIHTRESLYQIIHLQHTTPYQPGGSGRRSGKQFVYLGSK